MKWFYDMRTNSKLVLCFGALIAALCCVGSLGLSSGAEANAAFEESYNRDLIGLDIARRCEIARLDIARTFRSGMLAPDEAKKTQYVRDIDRIEGELRVLLDDLDGKIIIAENRGRVAEAKRTLVDFANGARESIRMSHVDGAKAFALHQQTTDRGNRIGELVGHIAANKREIAQASYRQNAAKYVKNRTMVAGLIAVSIFACIGLAIAVGRAITRPLAMAVAALERVARGDLAVRLTVDRKDELGMLGTALNQSLESVASTLEKVQEVANEVAAASSQLAAGSEQISSGAQEQAASLEETAASLEEISSTVKQNADSAQHAAQLAGGAREVAERGGQVVEAAVAAMREITKSSKQIADISTTIDEIAFQTNLLALNAAVEAARAGEQGRGFGVVAAEVRTLAQRTASAAREIRGLIADASSRVETGTAQVNQSGETLEEIVRSVKRVTDMIAEIAAASREQTAGLDQVNTAVTQVDQVTQSNAAQTEELSGTATALSEKSVYLREVVAKFDLGARRFGAPARTPTLKAMPKPSAPRARYKLSSPKAFESTPIAQSGVVRASVPPPALASSFEEF